MIAAEQQVHLAANIIRRVREMVANQPKAVAAVSLSRIVDDALALLAVASAFPKAQRRRRTSPPTPAACGATGSRSSR